MKKLNFCKCGNMEEKKWSYRCANCNGVIDYRYRYFKNRKIEQIHNWPKSLHNERKCKTCQSKGIPLKNAKRKLKKAIEEQNPKEIALASLECLMNDKHKLKRLSDLTFMTGKILQMEISDLKLLRKHINKMIKIKEVKNENRNNKPRTSRR